MTASSVARVFCPGAGSNLSLPMPVTKGVLTKAGLISILAEY